MKHFYPGFGGAWNTAASYIAGTANYLQDNIPWPTSKSALHQFTAIFASEPLAGSTANNASADKSAFTMVTEMATSAGARLLDFNQGVLKSVYGTLFETVDDCMYEMSEFLYDLGGWLRGDDPYPAHFGTSCEIDCPPEDSSMVEVSLTGVWAWMTGASTVEPDY